MDDVRPMGPWFWEEAKKNLPVVVVERLSRCGGVRNYFILADEKDVGECASRTGRRKEALLSLVKDARPQKRVVDFSLLRDLFEHGCLLVKNDDSPYARFVDQYEPEQVRELISREGQWVVVSLDPHDCREESQALVPDENGELKMGSY